MVCSQQTDNAVHATESLASTLTGTDRLVNSLTYLGR